MDLDFIRKMVRAVVQSRKEGVAMDGLHSEYRALCGECLPLARLGYCSLEDLLRDMPSVVRLQYCKGELRCFAVASEDTNHIAELIARQRSSNKSGLSQVVNSKLRFKPTNPYTKNVRPTPSLRQPRPGNASRCSSRLLLPPAAAASRGCSAAGDYRQSDERLKAVTPLHHRHAASQRPDKLAAAPDRKEKLENSKKPEEVPRRHASGPSGPANPPVPGPASPPVPGPSGPASPPYEVSSVQSRISLLLQKHSSGVWLSKLPEVYRRAFGQELPPQAVAHLEQWPHVCTVEDHSNANRTDKLLYPPVPPSRPPPVSPATLGTITPPPSPPSPGLNGSKFVLAKPTFIFPGQNAGPAPRVAGQNAGPAPRVAGHNASPAPQAPPQKREEKSDSPGGAIGDETRRTSGGSGNAPPPPPGCVPTPPVPGEVRRRMEDLLSRYSMGLWAHALPKLFMDTYKTPFPQRVLDNLSLLLDFCWVEYPSPHDRKKAILYRLEQPDLRQSTGCLLPSGVEVVAPVVPPRLVLPAEQFPSVLVTEARSSNAVTVRYVGENYSNAQETMEDTMASYYSRSSTSDAVSRPAVGQLVAVRGAEEGEELARAQVMEVISPSKVKVYYVDYGFSMETSTSSLLQLHQDFASLPFQAINVTLAGLEAFSSDPLVLSCLEATAVGKILLMETLEPSERDQAAMVVLYDTSQEDDVNINCCCLRALQDSGMNNPLQVGDTYRDVSVTNVCPDGVLHCQLPSRGTSRLSSLLERTEAFFASQMTSEHLVTKPFTGKLCLSRYRGRWARAEIVNLFGNRVAEIVFVDMGVPATVEVTDLREIPPALLQGLMVIPPQAVRCFLAELTVPEGDWSPAAVQQVKEAVQVDHDCRMKVLKIDEHKGDKLVYMYLFVGAGGQELHDSVNHRLLKLATLSDHGDAGAGERPDNATPSGNRNPAEQLPSARLGDAATEKPSLPPPLELPQPGHNMDVLVPVACHPGYFVVQRLEDLHKLTVLTGEMMLHYARAERSSAALERGEVYAAKIDRSWRRVQVKGVLSNGLVSVYELDHGKHELIRRTLIQPLAHDFRRLPFLATAAQLAGVEHQRWSEESSMLFRNKVEGRALVAQVESVQEVPAVRGVPWERRLTVYLVDTSAENADFWIHSIMADEKH